MNKIVVNFSTCDPAPSGGYNIKYRVAGSEDIYTDAGNFFISPAVFYDTTNPAGTCYEGFMQTNCGEVLGNPVHFETCGSGESGEERTLTFSITGTGAGANILAEFNNPVDVDLSIDSVFVDGYLSANCTGDVDSHMHSTMQTIVAGNTAYTGNDVSTGAWIGITSFAFYGIVLSWLLNSSVIIHDGDTIIMGSYIVTIIIEGC